jgi:hypothetical protein
MESGNYICGGSKFLYAKGYIGLPITITGLPESIVIEGQTLVRKNSFHVSLLCVKDLLAENAGIEIDVIKAFCTYANQNDIAFATYTGEFRFAQAGERKSLIALCEISNLHGLANEMSKATGLPVPSQPTHVTLYTLQPNLGIGLNSPQAMAAHSVSVEAPVSVQQALSIAA